METEQPSPSPRSDQARALLSGLPLVLYALLLVAFSLPFISVSSGESATGELSGHEVLQGEGRIAIPMVAENPPKGASKVNDALFFQQLMVVPIVFYSVLTVVLSLASGLLPGNRVLFNASLATALMATQGAVTSLGTAVAVTGPDVHHYIGSWLALTLVACGLLCRLGYALAMRSLQLRAGAGRPWLIFVACLAVLLIPGPSWDERAVVAFFGAILGFVLSTVFVVVRNDPRDLAVFIGTGLPLAFILGAMQ